MSALTNSTPQEVKEIAERARLISEEALKQAKSTIQRHEKQAVKFADNKLVMQSRFIRKWKSESSV